ncbi:snaclec rhodocetin subunit gamma-like [Asterias amurensis]|uniref:snaclec rhodocetin subunit gamma-like n=1 Tax=Asterias amurensis TaxID=7602 RepID=UPI003AB3C0B7
MASSFSVITFSILVALLQSHFLIISPCMSCISPWTSFGNHCYLSVMEEKTFNEAEQYCQSLSRLGRPSNLASIMSQEENDFLILLSRSISNQDETASWFGYREDRSNGSSTWYFIDGNPSVGYNNWGSGNPSGNGQCGLIVQKPATNTSFWNDLTCSKPRSSVCKIPARF